jgi:hypothetical protein
MAYTVTGDASATTKNAARGSAPNRRASAAAAHAHANAPAIGSASASRTPPTRYSGAIASTMGSVETVIQRPSISVELWTG